MSKTESKMDRWYCILLAVVGIVMSFAIPVLQSPDEQSHLRMIAASLNNEDIAENIFNDIEKNDYKIYFDESEDIHSYKINVSYYIQMMTKEPTYSWTSMLPRGVNLSVIKHLPSTIGIVVGCLLHLPSLAVMQLGEVFSVLGYVLLVYASLKVLPVKKTFFRCFATSPMIMQQISSVNYDAVLLPLCFLFIAYVLYVKFKKELFDGKDLLILASLLLVITYIKIPYFFLGLFVFVIPLRKYQVRIGIVTINEEMIRKYRILILFAFVIIAVLGGYLIRNQYYVRLVVSMVQERGRTVYLVKSTIKTWGEFIFISSVGNFGWLDTPVSIICAILIYGMFLLTAVWVDKDDTEQAKVEWRIQDYFIVLITFFLLCILIMMSMVNHTITVTLFGVEQIADYNMREALYQIPYIGGLQGRYFIPFLMLPFMLFPQLVTSDSKNKKNLFLALNTVFFVGIAIYVLYLLLNRYWIV